MTVAIHQPNYLPWLGFFNKMANADIFVLLDNVKHSKNSFTHRNQIKNNNKELLLTVPLENKESSINELRLFEPKVNLTKHWRSIEDSYRKAKYWNYFSKELKLVYTDEWTRLVDLNIKLITLVKERLGIVTKLIIASELNEITGEGSERNLNICKQLNADIYLSGSGARSYNDEESFNSEGIKIIYNNFSHPIYPQLGDKFLSNLSSIDLIFNCGSESKSILSNL